MIGMSHIVYEDSAKGLIEQSAFAHGCYNKSFNIAHMSVQLLNLLRLGQAQFCMYRFKLFINNQAIPSCHVSAKAGYVGFQNQQAASSTGTVHIYIVVDGWLA